MQPPIDELVAECERLHGHLCPGQILGVRMALLGCRLINIQDPRASDRKRFLVWVEIDRCMTDAVSAVTGARLGRRSLKFVDYGKVAASFLNLESGEAVRIVALEESRGLAETRFGHLAQKRDRQLHAYREAADAELFKVEAVEIALNEMDLPGRPRSRVVCGRCLEAVNDGREVGTSEPLCKACSTGAYYRRASDNE